MLKRNFQARVGILTQWESSYLARTTPHVQSPTTAQIKVRFVPAEHSWVSEWAAFRMIPTMERLRSATLLPILFYFFFFTTASSVLDVHFLKYHFSPLSFLLLSF